MFAAQRPQLGELTLRLDPFGDRREAERMGEIDDAGNDGAVALFLADAPEAVDERLVDLQRVDRETLQVRER